MVINEPLSQVFALSPGEALTVVADGVSSGIVVRLGNNAGDAQQGATAISASTTTVFGPYSVATRFHVQPTTGSLTVTQGLAAVGSSYAAYDLDLATIAAVSPSNDDVLQRKSGAWTNRSMAQVKTDLVLVKGDVGLGNVDNTSDASKPVSTATQTALDLKAPIASPTFTGTVGGISKSMVGLGNVDNTSDANKPISTAAQTALDARLRVAKATYSFAVSGGAQGTIAPVASDTIPDNAIIIGGQINSTTAVTSDGAATVAIGTSAGSSTTSIKAATGKASYSADALLNVVPTFAAALKMTAAGTITFTIADADLTDGVIEVFVFYVVASA